MNTAHAHPTHAAYMYELFGSLSCDELPLIYRFMLIDHYRSMSLMHMVNDWLGGRFVLYFPVVGL